MIYTSAIFMSAMVFLSVAFLCLDEQNIRLLGAENGAIENATAAGFALVAAIAFIVALKTRAEAWGLFSFFMALACLREMDMHRAFTSDSFLKLRFYSGDVAPMGEKVAGSLVIVLIAACAYRLIRYHFKGWIADVLKFEETALAVFLAVGSLGFAKILDSLKRLAPSLKEFHQENSYSMSLVEETFELAAVCMFLCVCLLWFKTNRSSHRE